MGIAYNLNQSIDIYNRSPKVAALLTDKVETAVNSVVGGGQGGMLSQAEPQTCGIERFMWRVV